MADSIRLSPIRAPNSELLTRSRAGITKPAFAISQGPGSRFFSAAGYRELLVESRAIKALHRLIWCALTITIMRALSLQCAVSDEDVFGPIVNSSCRHGFDFTLLFEEIVLTFLPLLITSPIVLIRLWRIRNVSQKVNRSWFYFTKEV